MADDKKKAVAKENTSKAAKTVKKAKFSPKNIGKAIARFFKDLRGETKKIVWPTGKMVIKSTGIVLAAVIVIGAGIWLIDFALAGAVGAVDKLADNVTTTEAVSESVDETESLAESVEETTESTTAA